MLSTINVQQNIITFWHSPAIFSESKHSYFQLEDGFLEGFLFCFAQITLQDLVPFTSEPRGTSLQFMVKLREQIHILKYL